MKATLAKGRPSQAIVTKHIGPTDTKGARIKAVTAGGESLTTRFRTDLSVPDAHAFAALSLADKLGWKGRLVQGSIKGSGYVFVLMSR